MNELTIEQHLKNILFAIKKATMTGEEHEAVAGSYNHIIGLLTPKPEVKEEVKEDKKIVKS
jgi:hypothetical protein